MTLEAIYFASQIVAAVALVGSLLFVGVQIRQSSRTQRAQAAAYRSHRISRFNEQFTDPKKGLMFVRGAKLAPDLTEDEKRQFIFAAMESLSGFEELYNLHREGQLDADRWRRTAGTIDWQMQYPGLRAAYRIFRGNNPESAITRIIDPLAERYRGTRPPEGIAEWDEFARLELDAIAEAEDAAP